MGGPYDIAEHRHRFAAWAAARAAQRGWKGATVPVLKRALEQCGVTSFVQNEEWDSVTAEHYDVQHRQWCRQAICSLETAGVQESTFGRAAKLIAIYVKSFVVLGNGTETALARVAYPPIDNILLENLSKSNEIPSPHKRGWGALKWTKLDLRAHEQLIRQLRSVLSPGEPFWKLERFWTVSNQS